MAKQYGLIVPKGKAGGSGDIVRPSIFDEDSESDSDTKKPTGLTTTLKRQTLVEKHWSREQITMLIRLYQNLPCLYDDRHENYNCRSTRTSHLQQILSQIQLIRPETRVEDIKIKLKNLRTQYMSERRKIRRAKMGPKGFTYESKLWCFPYLEFLDPHLKSKDRGHDESIRLGSSQNGDYMVQNDLQNNDDEDYSYNNEIIEENDDNLSSVKLEIDETTDFTLLSTNSTPSTTLSLPETVPFIQSCIEPVSKKPKTFTNNCTPDTNPLELPKPCERCKRDPDSTALAELVRTTLDQEEDLEKKRKLKKLILKCLIEYDE